LRTRSPTGSPAEAVGHDAVRRFRAHNPDLRLAPVAAIIPAFNEEACLGDVLDAMPATACGLAVSTVVVDDGSADATAIVARDRGVAVARLERNCGQGTAFRAGYAIARDHGARYIVTLDADGQWDPADIPAVLEPVVGGDADLVLGSRVLGSSESGDMTRAAGVRVFAALVRLLTGARVTDTSSGLRAMRAELTAAVPQRQPQYQSSELLIGALTLGYRVTERPVVMHPRAAGMSKKGRNLFYGARYARVVVGSWWRARRLAS
jgi:glycosyltransferase involved in cell wall biosynthesis